MEYFLTTTRLGFRRWSEPDLPLAMELWGDPQVSAYIGGPFTAEMVRSRLQQEIRREQEMSLQYWPFLLLDGNRHAGCAGLRPYRMEERVYELGTHLRRAYWGQGLAKEAARSIIDYGFGTLGARALFAGHHPRNEASRRLSSRARGPRNLMKTRVGHYLFSMV
jgi:[ribosomal protein S5]-alanine N-acetyltransferase